jgi:hypothetical protein
MSRPTIKELQHQIAVLESKLERKEDHAQRIMRLADRERENHNALVWCVLKLKEGGR